MPTASVSTTTTWGSGRDDFLLLSDCLSYRREFVAFGKLES
jgi:hypothetical protein